MLMVYDDAMSEIKDTSIDNSSDKNADSRYRHEERFISRLNITCIWGVKRGLAVFDLDAARADFEESIYALCRNQVWDVIYIRTYPNHVRVRLQIWRSQSADQVIKALKRATVKIRDRWEDQLPFALPAMWTDGYFVDFAADPDEETVQQHLIRDRQW